MASKNYRDLIVWQKSMDLVDQIYALTKDFPHEEIFGLTNQIRRSATSIPSNSLKGKEGAAQGNLKDF
jgi:four helix bundle protein